MAKSLFQFGHYAVDLFIVLSGFCLMLPIVRGDGTLRGGIGRFYLKRARRIQPPYYLAIGCSLLLIWLLIGAKTGTHWDYSVPVDFKGLLLHLLLLEDAANNMQINQVLWSVAVQRHGWVGCLLAWRPLVFIGMFGYSLYLMHAPLIQVIWQYGTHPLYLNPVSGFAVLSLVGLPLILAGSYLLFLVCERLFLNTRRRKRLAETERAAALSPAP